MILNAYNDADLKEFARMYQIINRQEYFKLEVDKSILYFCITKLYLYDDDVTVLHDYVIY